MAISAAELAIQRVNTRAFIAADEFGLALTRYTVGRVPGGGEAVTGAATLATQAARLIPTTPTAPEIPTPDGRIVRPEWVVLLMPESTIARGDEFVFRGRTYQVAALGANDYELKAQAVSKHGPE